MFLELWKTTLQIELRIKRNSDISIKRQTLKTKSPQIAKTNLKDTEDSCLLSNRPGEEKIPNVLKITNDFKVIRLSLQSTNIFFR